MTEPVALGRILQGQIKWALGRTPRLRRRAISAHGIPDASMNRATRFGPSVNAGSKPLWAKEATSAIVSALASCMRRSVCALLFISFAPVHTKL